MSAFVWLRGPFFLACTSGAMYSRVPTSAKESIDIFRENEGSTYRESYLHLE